MESALAVNEQELVILELREYYKDRDISVVSDKWALAARAVEQFSSGGYWEFAELFDRTVGMLWQQQEDFIEDQKRIYAEVIQPAEKLFKPQPLPDGDGIAWLVRNCSIGLYAPYKHVKAFVRGMNTPQYLYCYGPCTTSEKSRLEAEGVIVRVVNNPDSIREHCESDKIGTLIADSYAAMVLTIFKMRSARQQFYLSPGFQMFPADKVLIPPTQFVINENATQVHSPMCWEDLYESVAPIDKPAKVVFGTLGRYEKISNEFLVMVKSILDAVPGSVYCAWGAGSASSGDERIRFMAPGDPHAILPTIDVYLDSYPLCGGVSVWEAMAHRVPVVTRSSSDVDSWNHFKPHVVHGADCFVEKALSLLKNPETDNGLRIAKNFSDVKAAGQHLLRVINGDHDL